MKANRTVNLRVRATPAKFARLFEIASACRFVWNWAVRENDADMQAHFLSQCSGGPGLPKPSTAFPALCRRFPHLRNVERPWLQAYAAHAVRYTLKRFDVAFKAFYDDVKQGRPRRMAPPKFHGKSHRLWVTFPDSFRIQGKWLHLSRIGWVRLSGSNQYAGATAKTVHLASEDGKRWYATISYEVELPDAEDNGLALGVDMNCGQVATSAGDIMDTPDVSRLEARRKRYQRRMARCVKGSNRRKVMRQRMAKAARAKCNVGRNWRHKASRALADSAGLVVVEDLAVARMTRAAKGTKDAPGKNVRQKAGLNRSILATGWGDLRLMLEYKAAHIVAVDPRDTSRTCRACGHVDTGNRVTQADFECLACGHTGNADVNAALNILARGDGASGRRGAIPLGTSMTRQPQTSRLAAA